MIINRLYEMQYHLFNHDIQHLWIFFMCSGGHFAASHL